MEFTVNKKRLLQTLLLNRDEHVEQYQTAMDRYQRKAIEFFNGAIAKIKEGGQVERYLNLPMPEEHTEDFDRAIEALDWHIGDEVTLNEVQFEELVRNRWGWHKSFLANTASYLAT